MKKTFLTSAMAILACAGCALLPSKTKVEQDMDSAIDVLEKNNSTIIRKVLDNGMICLAREDKSAPVVSMQIWVRVGSINEGRFLGAGLCHAIEHMIFKGTKNLSPGDLSRLVNNAGGEINAYTSLDRTVFHADMPARNWKVGLDVFAESLRNAEFLAEEWEKERDVILREFAMGYDSPERTISKLMTQAAFTTHPYRFPVIGHEDVFKTITREDLLSFFRENYTPDNMITVVVGDVPASEIIQAIEKAFGDWPRKARPPAVVPQEAQQIAPRFERKEGPYNVSRIAYTWHTVNISNPDAPLLDLLAEIVGTGRSSRLTKNILEKQKLVTQINGWSFTPLEPGMFGISAVFEPDKEREVIDAINKEILDWIQNGFSDTEVEKAKRLMMSNSLGELQTMKGQANSLGSGEFYAVDPGFTAKYLRSLRNARSEEIVAVAKKYLTENNRTIVILAPDGTASDTSSENTAIAPSDPKMHTLQSGLKVIVKEDRRLPFVYMCAAIKGGLLSENNNDNGISRLISDLLMRGTHSRAREEIALSVESCGGRIFPFSGNNSFGLRAQCMKPDAELFMDIVSDCLLAPAFFPEEVEKQRTIQLSAIGREEEQPFAVARDAMRKLVFGEHPYGLNALGTKESVKALTRDQLIAHHKSGITAENIVLCIIGDIEQAAALKMADKYFSKIKPSKTEEKLPPPAKPELPAHKVVEMPKEQAIIIAAFPGVDALDPMNDALSILDNALSGLSSEIGTEVREKRGLAYFVGAFNMVGMHPGTFALYAGTKPDKVNEVEQLFLAEIKRLSTSGLNDEEFERARDQIITGHEMSLQDSLGLAMKISLDELSGLGFNYHQSTVERIQKITKEDVKNAAVRILDAKKMAVSIVIPTRKEQ